MAGHIGSMLDADQCWSLKLIKNDQALPMESALPCELPCESTPALWVLLVRGLNRTWEMHCRKHWINAWYRSMLISTDEFNKIDLNRTGLGWLSTPAMRNWLEGWTGPKRRMARHVGSMLDTDQCWSTD